MNLATKYPWLNKYTLGLFVATVVFYWVFAYQLDRSDFPKLISLVIGLFIPVYYLIGRFGLQAKTLIGFGILARLIFIVALPNLSQDYYRFIWDGRLILEGINPYLNTPFVLLEGSSLPIAQAQELFNGMGTLSANNFSNYPPLNQLFFSIAAYFGGKSILGTVIAMRLIIILADIGVVLLSIKILKHFKLPVNRAFWYFLNPFIIIELTGNLHFEGVMCFFIIASLYLLLKQRWVFAAILLGSAVSVKLIPLLFLPLFFRYFVKRGTILPDFAKLSGFYMVVFATVALTFIPFFSEEFIQNFTATIGLWFTNFEFNASIYYIIREIGFATIGWNIIEDVGKVLPIIVLAIVLLLSFFRKNEAPKGLFTGMLLALGVYLLLATTVHPWYLTTLVLLSLFTKYKFALHWSAVVFFSYSAYGANGFQENLWLVGLEYCLVTGYFVWELYKNDSPKASLN